MNYQHVVSRFDYRAGTRSNLWEVRCPCGGHRDGDRRPSARLWIDESTQRLCWWCAKGCSWKEVVAITGTKEKDWFPEEQRQAKRMQETRIIKRYDYVDEHGELLYQVCRMDPKGFCQCRPVEDGWAYTLSEGDYIKVNQSWKLVPGAAGALKLPEVRRVLYCLPELLNHARKSEPIFVVEGEKDADNLRGLGFLATTNAGGAGKWRHEYGTAFVGRNVCIIPDMDNVGYDHAAVVAGNAMMHRANGIRLLYLRPDHWPMGSAVPEKADVSDWLSALPGPRLGMKPTIEKQRSELKRIIIEDSVCYKQS
jgi:hypothetical protein